MAVTTAHDGRITQIHISARRRGNGRAEHCSCRDVVYCAEAAMRNAAVIHDAQFAVSGSVLEEEGTASLGNCSSKRRCIPAVRRGILSRESS